MQFNIEDILENKLRNQHYMLCRICGCVLYKSNKSRHQKTIKCLGKNYLDNNRFEVERIKPSKEDKHEIVSVK